jgi:hypothetical protein
LGLGHRAFGSGVRRLKYLLDLGSVQPPLHGLFLCQKSRVLLGANSGLVDGKKANQYDERAKKPIYGRFFGPNMTSFSHVQVISFDFLVVGGSKKRITPAAGRGYKIIFSSCLRCAMTGTCWQLSQQAAKQPFGTMVQVLHMHERDQHRSERQSRQQWSQFRMPSARVKQRLHPGNAVIAEKTGHGRCFERSMGLHQPLYGQNGLSNPKTAPECAGRHFVAGLLGRQTQIGEQEPACTWKVQEGRRLGNIFPQTIPASYMRLLVGEDNLKLLFGESLKQSRRDEDLWPKQSHGEGQRAVRGQQSCPRDPISAEGPEVAPEVNATIKGVSLKKKEQGATAQKGQRDDFRQGGALRQGQVELREMGAAGRMLVAMTPVRDAQRRIGDKEQRAQKGSHRKRGDGPAPKNE